MKFLVEIEVPEILQHLGSVSLLEMVQEALEDSGDGLKAQEVVLTLSGLDHGDWPTTFLCVGSHHAWQMVGPFWTPEAANEYRQERLAGRAGVTVLDSAAPDKQWRLK